MSFLETAAGYMLSGFLADGKRTSEALEVIDRSLESVPSSRKAAGVHQQTSMTTLYEVALEARRAFLRGEPIERPDYLGLEQGSWQAATAWLCQDLLDIALQRGDLATMETIVARPELASTPEPLPRLELVLSCYGAALRVKMTADEHARQEAERALAALGALGHPRSFRRVEALLSELSSAPIAGP
jgi:hypothetical protein